MYLHAWAQSLKVSEIKALSTGIQALHYTVWLHISWTHCYSWQKPFVTTDKLPCGPKWEDIYIWIDTDSFENIKHMLTFNGVSLLIPESSWITHTCTPSSTHKHRHVLLVNTSPVSLLSGMVLFTMSFDFSSGSIGRNKGKDGSK